MSVRVLMNRSAAISAALAAALCTPAIAAEPATRYPVKPIRLVVPLAPAGSTDIVARLVAQKYNEAWGQPVIVDNRPGAGTTIGSAVVARAAPDGYTLLFASISLASSVPLYKSLPYDPLRDFAAIGPVGQSFYVLAVHPSVPVNTVQELIAMARAKPKQLSYASAGTGTITHFTVELFMSQAKIDMLHVPFKGGAPALTAFIGGQVQVIFNPIAEILPQIKAGGKVRTLAVTAPKRSLDLPNVPTLAETVLPGFSVTPRSGIYAPAGTPRAIVNQLNAELNRMLSQADMRERLQGHGLIPVGGAPAELDAYLKAEIVRWSKVAREAGVKPE
jgi:tripartite-type tricarboxylate transporter receptor subunit TctC